MANDFGAQFLASLEDDSEVEEVVGHDADCECDDCYYDHVGLEPDNGDAFVRHLESGGAY